MLSVGSNPGGPFRPVDKGTYTLADARANVAKQRPAKKRGYGWHPAGARPRPRDFADYARKAAATGV